MPASDESDARVDGQPGPTTLARNWNELLQELRVTQTGVQILTGFLLTVPFTNRFDTLSMAQRQVYVAVLVGAVVTTGLVTAPVALHRALFRRRKRLLVVEVSHRLARVGLATLALTLTGVLYLCLDVTLGHSAAIVGLVGGAVGLLGLWFVIPYWLGRRDVQPPNALPGTEQSDGSDLP